MPFGTRKHPLDYTNRYQLAIMVILSAQDSDRHINALAKHFFTAYPSIHELANASIEDIKPFKGSVVNFGNKANWIIQLAKTVGDESKIPRTLEELIRLPGIGRNLQM